MGKFASKVVEQAKAWLGKKESDGTHKEIIDVYNSHKPLARGYKMKYTDAWCSCFVSAVAIKLGYTDIIPTEVGCGKHIDLFKKINCWVEDENRVPKAGDIIFYDWDDSGIGDNKGNSDHVGIVEKVEGSTITVIEGNISNSVGRRKIAVNGKYIRGYGVPKYDVETVENIVNNNTNQSDIIYKVVNGDTLSKIANQFNTTVQKLAEYNNIENPNCIYVNQIIKIPNTNQVNSQIQYTVKSGDTLSSVAAKYNISYQKIYQDNKATIDNENKKRGVSISKMWIYPNQVLVIK